MPDYNGRRLSPVLLAFAPFPFLWPSGLHKFRRLRPFNLPALSNWNSGRQGGTLCAKQFALRTYKHEHCVQTKLERRGWPILKQGEGVIQLCYTWLASGQWPKQRGVTSTCCWTLFPTWTFCLHLESWSFICPTYYLDLTIHLNIPQSTCWCDWPPLKTCLMPKPMFWLACISFLYFGWIWAKAIKVRAEGLKCSLGERSQQIPRRILM